MFVIIATEGRHDALYADHGSSIRDVRKKAMEVFGYSVRYPFCRREQRQRVMIRLSSNERGKLKCRLLRLATSASHRAKERMEREFKQLPYQIYAPVFGQLRVVVREVNRARRTRAQHHSSRP